MDPFKYSFSLCVRSSFFNTARSLMSKRRLSQYSTQRAKDITASLLKGTCHGVATEPSLQPVTSESLDGASTNKHDGARLDIVAYGFWGSSFERTFFDVRVFNPLVPSNRRYPLPATYRNHEKEKKRQYEQRIREIEHSSFCPLVFSLTGGLAPTATVFYKRLASQLSDKWKQKKLWVHNGLAQVPYLISLVRSCIMCIQGARSSAHIFNHHLASTVDLTIADTNLVP